MNEIISRKQAHLDICLHSDVESNTTRLDAIHVVHHALSSLHIDIIDCTTSFLGYTISAPFFISCMTGGSKDAHLINKRLAMAAEQTNIPVGLGSVRVLLEHEQLLPEFQLKSFAPSVPLLANLGASELRTIDMAQLEHVLTQLQADALVLHINPAQELCQTHGERDFTGIVDSIRSYIIQSPRPVIVKETGFGFTPAETLQLLGYGAKYVDIAGAGGTNWAKIELYREHDIQHDALTQSFMQSYEQWGNPTGLLLLALYGTPGIIASGGVRTVHDILVGMALGAQMVGLALPFVRAAHKGTDTLISYITEITTQLRQLMLLSGAQTIADLPNISLWLEPHVQQELYAFCKATAITVPERFA